MNILFDASAIFKRYSGETGVAQVLSLQARASRITAAAHCKTEVASALTRQWRDRLFTDDEYERILAAIHTDFDELTVMPLSSPVERYAIAAMRMATLRGMDALHIGSAQAANVDLFVTADRRQAQAAQAVGLKTELIEA
ncbi:MAG: type II toxin-antitoxin system VapC family toxin [Pseudomonadota bacterium]